MPVSKKIYNPLSASLRGSIKFFTPATRPNRLILHIDMDAFFVSVEQAHNPRLRHKPVIVAGRPEKRHGVVCSASYEARIYGIRAGMPLGTAQRLCPSAIIIPTNHSRYLEYSEKIEDLLRKFSPLVEMASLDEAFVDITGTERLHKSSPLGIAHKIHKRIKDELGLPCSIGIASTRVVAKIAAQCAKPRGILWVLPGKEREFLRSLPVEKMPGIGSRTAEVLHNYGLTTLGDLQNIGEQWLTKLFGAIGRELYLHACGIDRSPVVSEGYLPKSVSRSYTFPRDLYNEDEIKSAISYLCELVAVELRRLNARATVLSLCVRYTDFDTLTRSMKLSIPIDDEITLLHSAIHLFNRMYDRRRAVRLLGVGAGELLYSCWQQDLFNPSHNQRRRQRLHHSVDYIKRRHGFNAIMHGTTFTYFHSEKGLILHNWR